MEQLEIHSKSYLVRWIHVPANRTLSWSVQPHKKSINLGIFKHPGGNTSNATPASTYEPPLTPQLDGQNSPAPVRNEASNAAKKLQGLGLILILWLGRCEAEKVATGRYDVPTDQGGMYAIVFDNTFSKQTSKTATLVLMTYPTGTPPLTSQYPLHLKAGAAAATSQTSLNGRASPRISPLGAESSESLHETGTRSKVPSLIVRQDSTCGSQHETSADSTFYTGMLMKRRRKRHQGYARRFFSLDFTSCTLSYYHSRNSSALRGAIPLTLAEIGVNKKTREISVDSGAEVWHLRAANQKDFAAWRQALQRASRSDPNVTPSTTVFSTAAASQVLPGNQTDEDPHRWGRVEALVGRVAGIRDAVRRLASATESASSSSTSQIPIYPDRFEDLDVSPTELNNSGGDYFQGKEKHRLWKRRTGGGPRTTGIFRRASAQRDISPVSNASSTTPSGRQQLQQRAVGGSDSMHGHCLALLKDLDSVVADFTQLISTNKRLSSPEPAARLSTDSISTEQFYDADDGGGGHQSQLLDINNDSDHDHDNNNEEHEEDEEVYDDASDSGGSNSDVETPEENPSTSGANTSYQSLFLTPPDSLSPLPLNPVIRRSTIPPAVALPPSLIGFLRKNVGKDLSTVSMPVSANEPISLLQRISEQLEYSTLLDRAATNVNISSQQRLFYVTAFFISSLSNSRVKERAIRKPFNPMLGETFELVREDMGFRFLAEKISHRPLRMACQAESKNWTYTQSPTPTQKFWGKSAELITEGKCRVMLHPSGEIYSYCPATCFLRNLIAGEKYVEPVGSVTIVNETSGEKCVVTFKSKGMFSGRSEEVIGKMFDAKGGVLTTKGLVGKWTHSLEITPSEAGGMNGDEIGEIWKVGDLVKDAPTRYGFTKFAASLNEITEIEKGKLPPTDSRLRPDQRLVENGELEKAEEMKSKLEDGQRKRRVTLEEEGKEWVPRWFERVSNTGAGSGSGSGSEESRDVNGNGNGDTEGDMWRLKQGREGYWETRERGQGWEGVVDIFDI
ncbi:MAG: hypothetical protein M1823_005895 [Watsoniomyces obsoletus]|nr:MAG: hypothetical protein M1823_005895 [Watsoniomyces obsoletus]